jgi:hypothetical protein
MVVYNNDISANYGVIMIKEINVKSLRSPAMLVEKVIGNTKGGILLIETDGDSQIPEISELIKKMGYKMEVDGTNVKVSIGEIEATKSINVVGASCPGPILMVGEVLERMAVGEILEIVAGANAFTDLTEGLKSMGNDILSAEKTGDGNYKILIKKEEKKKELGVSVDIDEVFIINMTGTGNAEKAYATFMMTEVAQNMKLKPTIFLMFDGASLALKGECDKVKHPAFPKLGDKLRAAIKSGVKIYVCEMSSEFRGVDKKLEDGIEIAGAPTFFRFLSKPNARPVWL